MKNCFAFELSQLAIQSPVSGVIYRLHATYPPRKSTNSNALFPTKTGAHAVRDRPSKSCKTGRSGSIPDYGQKRKGPLKTVSPNLRGGVAERQDQPAQAQTVPNLTVYQDGQLCNLKPEAHCTIIHRAARLMRQHWSDDHRDIKPTLPKFKRVEQSSKALDEYLMRHYTVPATCQEFRGAVPGDSRCVLTKRLDAAPESKPRGRDVQKIQTTAQASPASSSPMSTKPKKATKSDGAGPKPRRKGWASYLFFDLRPDKLFACIQQPNMTGARGAETSPEFEHAAAAIWNSMEAIARDSKEPLAPSSSHITCSSVPGGT